jgi:hypothetical protein
LEKFDSVFAARRDESVMREIRHDIAVDRGALAIRITKVAYVTIDDPGAGLF